MERRLDAALWPHTTAHVARHLERRHARGFRHERQRLEIKHQVDVLFVIVRYPKRSRRQRASRAARVVLFDLLDAPLDFADVLEIGFQPAPVARAKRTLQPCHVMRYPVERSEEHTSEL